MVSDESSSIQKMTLSISLIISVSVIDFKMKDVYKVFSYLIFYEFCFAEVFGELSAWFKYLIAHWQF